MAEGGRRGRASPLEPRRASLIEVHLYGALRRFASDQDPRGESTCWVSADATDTIASILHRMGIPEEELSPNVFLNGEYSALSRRVGLSSRLGLFPRDMGLLYSWHFDKAAGSPRRADD